MEKIITREFLNSDHMLRFSSVRKQFSKVRAVDDLSFEVADGEIFALLGPNGAGKTTTVRMIMQIISPDSGTISFSPSVMQNGRVNRARLGYLPEERGLYQDTSLINTLTYLACLRGSDPVEINLKALEWLERFGLSDRRNEKVSALSKGNQQKVQFIASILHRPDFAVLDEPFSGFDPINQELITQCIRELRDGGMTILLSAHQMQLVENIADRILMINKGKAMLMGTMDEIRRDTVSDQKLLVEYNQTVKTEAFSGSPSIKQFIHTGNGVWEIYLADQANLNDVLSDLTGAGTIISLKTSEVNLHDIFIQSFKETEGLS